MARVAKGFEKKDAGPLGIFNYAHSYWASASALAAIEVDCTHRNAPVDYLFFHAIELFLKSFLHLRGLGYEQLIEFSHWQRRLLEKAVDLGLAVEPQHVSLVALVDETYIEARYLKTGSGQSSRTADLWDLCSVLFDQIGGELVATGAAPRLPKRPLRPFHESRSLTVEEAAALLIVKRSEPVIEEGGDDHADDQ